MSQDTNRRGAKAFQKRRSSPAIYEARARSDKCDDRRGNAGWRQETAPLLPKKQDYNRHLLDGFFQFYQLASHGLKLPIFFNLNYDFRKNSETSCDSISITICEIVSRKNSEIQLSPAISALEAFRLKVVVEIIED